MQWYKLCILPSFSFAHSRGVAMKLWPLLFNVHRLPTFTLYKGTKKSAFLGRIKHVACELIHVCYRILAQT